MQKLKKYLFHTRCFESSGLSPNFASNIKTNLRQYTNKKDVKLNEWIIGKPNEISMNRRHISLLISSIFKQII